MASYRKTYSDIKANSFGNYWGNFCLGSLNDSMDYAWFTGLLLFALARMSKIILAPNSWSVLPVAVMMA